MTSTIKVNNIQNQCGANIINESSNTITIGASGDTVSLASGASQTGFGRTGTVDWQTTVKTATFTAVSGEGYFCNTTSGAFEVDLPAGSAGAIVALKDYAATWDTNALTIDPNGSEKIGGGPAGEPAEVSTEGASITLVYVDSTQGWVVVNDATQNVVGLTPAFVAATGGTVTTCGDFKYHKFTGPGTFTVSCAGNSRGSNTVQALVVAGGGGGTANGGGGGGAGGFRNISCISVCAQGYPITVGSGASGGPPSKPSNGSNSIFSTVTSTGGGGGGEAGGQPVPQRAGAPGGSGGGSGGNGGNPSTGGSGNTPPVTPPQGNDGGSNGPQPNYNAGSGGGGASCAGASGESNGSPGSSPGGNGGAGTDASPSFPAPLGGSPAGNYAGGGGGGANNDGPSGPSSSGGTGGTGGGANGAAGPGATAGSGTANTGGGGGGAPTAGTTAGSGGSGIVIIKYKFQ